jgi:hypothetical protein
MFEYWKIDNKIVFIFWFEESLEKASLFFADIENAPIRLLLARETISSQLAGHTLVFAEHYPMRSKELELFQKLNLQNPVVYSSLSEPLFKRFGSDKIIELMKNLGMKEDEAIEHNMVSRSIGNAQEKIEKKVTIDQTARSQEGWLQKNLIG